MSGCDFMKKRFSVPMSGGEPRNRRLGSGKVYRVDCESCKKQGQEICDSCIGHREFERREE